MVPGHVQRLSAFLVLGLSSTLYAAAPANSLESLIAREMSTSGVPGLAYAVVTDGKVTQVGSRGVVRLGSDNPVTDDTPFLTGSISKSFTALAVMQLVEAGLVELDSDISQYLNVLADRPAGAITVRQLLSHTSGFSTRQGNAAREMFVDGEDVLARGLDRIAKLKPAYTPGSRWEYSNTNYEILGRLIEVLSGQSYQTYVTRNILEPVGMGHSFVADGQQHPAMATGHLPWFGGKRPLPHNRTDRGTAPQGGIVASAPDLARYMSVMCNGEDDVLSAEGKALMLRPASASSPFYGFGWFIDRDEQSVWHAGASPGFETLATMVPDERRGVVVLANAGSGIGFGETLQLRNAITAHALGRAYTGEGNRWSQKLLFVSLCLLPLVFVFSTYWAWRQRATLRAKSGAFGLFSLWFPLCTTLGMAWVFFDLMPQLFGVSLHTLYRFSPDLAGVMVASAATGVVWAVVRLAIAYTGRKVVEVRDQPSV